MLILCFPLNTLFLLVFAISLGITKAAPILLYFNLEKHCWYFGFRFLTTVDLFYCFFFRLLNAKYIDCTWFVFCWQSPKAQELPFNNHFNIEKYQRYLVYYLLLSKYVLSTIFWRINQQMDKPIYLLLVYTLNTPRTSYFFVYNCWKRNICISCCTLVFETSIVPFFLLGNYKTC